MIGRSLASRAALVAVLAVSVAATFNCAPARAADRSEGLALGPPPVAVGGGEPLALKLYQDHRAGQRLVLKPRHGLNPANGMMVEFVVPLGRVDGPASTTPALLETNGPTASLSLGDLHWGYYAGAAVAAGAGTALAVSQMGGDDGGGSSDDTSCPDGEIYDDKIDRCRPVCPDGHEWNYDVDRCVQKQ